MSVAGRRAGLDGERSGLWWQFHRIIDELRPRWVVIENVPGLLSSNDGRDMATLLHALGELGYWWSYRVLDAQWFGVAQRRRRVFIVGHSGDRAAPAKVLLEPNRRTWNPAPRREAGERVAGHLTVDANQYSGFPGEPVEMLGFTKRGGFGISVHKDITGTLDRDQNIPMVAHTLSSEGSDASEDDTGRGTPLVGFNWQNMGNVGYAFTPDGVGPLDTSQTKAVYGQAMAVRRLTPTECLRLQGFSNHWLDLDPPISDSAKYRMTGNAVCANVAEWIGRRIMEHEAAS